MMLGSVTLPEGRQGQALAVGLTAAAAALLWMLTAAPLIGWYQTRATELAQQQQLAAHMVLLGQEIPALRSAISDAGLQSAGQQILLDGSTDAIAGANLQTALQNMATQAGTSLDSAELLPVQPTGGLRRIGMQVSITASWPVLIAFLEAIETARPRMIVSDITLASTALSGADPNPQVQASFAVNGFRAGSP